MSEITGLDVVFGEFQDFEQVNAFVESVRNANCEGTLYIGYPVLSIDDGKIEFDAVLVSKNKGVIIFDLYADGSISPNGVIPKKCLDRQEQLYAALYNRLNSFKELRSGRQLGVHIYTVSITPLSNCKNNDDLYNQYSLDCFAEFYEGIPESNLSESTEQHLNAAIQRISNLRPPKKRDNVVRVDSKGAKIKQIEAQIANLDLWQKRGSIEYVNGPQRIRGLAGSGKTVVLALKAAYLHVKRPDWDIAITFNSRALYQQFESLITRFVFSQINDEPDWSKLHIMHAWGDSRAGVYSTVVNKLGIQHRDFTAASRLWGYNTAFKGACDEVLSTMGSVELDLFDIILVDEAQDLPSSFFKILYQIVRQPKRIVWAYDDLQNLGDYKMPSAEDLFGNDKTGKPLVSLKNIEFKPQEDIVLPRCYRTPPWSLSVAHALGFGIHKKPMVQMFPQPDIWLRLGYESINDNLAVGASDISLRRDSASIPEFFGKLLSPSESLQFKEFKGKDEQYLWVATEIKNLIDNEELQPSDFLIVIPDTYRSKSIGASLLKALMSVDLSGRIPGVNSSRDSLFTEGMISITHIYRAKGNEAPVVFVVDADYCNFAFEQKQRRNILFTAMTRARAWTYVTGCGANFSELVAEYNQVVSHDYKLEFDYPSQAALNAMAANSDVAMDDIRDFEEVKKAIKIVQNQDWNKLPVELKQEVKDALISLNPNEP